MYTENWHKELSRNGLLVKEIKDLSKSGIKPDDETLQSMIKSRKTLIRIARRKGWSKQKLRGGIIRFYKRKGYKDTMAWYREEYKKGITVKSMENYNTALKHRNKGYESIKGN